MFLRTLPKPVHERLEKSWFHGDLVQAQPTKAAAGVARPSSRLNGSEPAHRQTPLKPWHDGGRRGGNPDQPPLRDNALLASGQRSSKQLHRSRMVDSGVLSGSPRSMNPHTPPDACTHGPVLKTPASSALHTWGAMSYLGAQNRDEQRREKCDRHTAHTDERSLGCPLGDTSIAE